MRHAQTLPASYMALVRAKRRHIQQEFEHLRAQNRSTTGACL